jgi:7-cyano-7-deazaguanine synthase
MIVTHALASICDRPALANVSREISCFKRAYLFDSKFNFDNANLHSSKTGVNMQKKSVILFSGGLDSTTCLAIAKAQGFEVYALSFRYGQKHEVEVDRAIEIAKYYEVAGHQVLTLPIVEIGGSSLIDVDSAVPDYSGTADIPSTYVPARNTIFLSYALGYAEVIQAHDIFIGANHIDYSGYPDCRPDYLQAFEVVANLATKAGREGHRFHIHAPLLQLDKAGIIQLGHRHGVNYQQTVSCYRADTRGYACGKCDSCVYRKKGFKDAGVSDPTLYYT